MALEEKTVTIPMRFGQDEGTDKGSDLNGLMAIENGIYDKEGALRPRFGFQVESNFAQETRGLVVSGETLGVVTRDGILPYDPGSGLDPSETGFSASALSRAITTIHGGRSIVSSYVAVTTGTDGTRYAALITAEEAATTAENGVWFRLFNYDTGSLVFVEQHPSAIAGHYVQVHAVGTSFLFVYWFGDSLEDPFPTAKIQAVNLNPATRTLGTYNTIVSGHDSVDGTPESMDSVYDSSLNKVFVGYTRFTPEEFRVKSCDTSGAVTATSSAASVASHPTDQTVGLALVGDWVVSAYLAQSDRDVHLQSFARADLALGSNLDTGLDGNTTLINVSFDIDPETTAAFNLLASRSSTEKSLYIQGLTFTNATGVFALGALEEVENVMAVSKPFRLSNYGSAAVLVIHSASEEHAYLGVQAMSIANKNLIAALATDEARPYGSTHVSDLLTSVASVSDDVFAVSLVVALESASAGEIFAGNPLVYRARISELDFTNRAIPFAIIEGATYLAGAIPREFDGRRAQEAAMMSAPPKPTVSGVADGAPSDVTYQYATVVEQTDRYGNIRLSPPSVVSTLVIAPSNTAEITAYGQIRPVADLESGEDDVRVLRVYRTTENGSVFYLHTTSTEDPLFMFDSMADADLSLASQLDVTGVTELLSEPVPALRAVWAHGNRLFGIRAETPRILSYTKSMEQPDAPSWNSVLSKTIETSGGDLVAGGSLPGKCILFQENQILVMGGRGPSNAGPDASGDGYDDPEPVSNGVGAVDAVCVVPIPGGIFFRGKTGFHILANDCSVTYVGQGVQDQEAAMGETAMAVYLPSFHQVWISGADSDGILVFDTRFGRWSTLSGPWASTSRVVGCQEIAGTVYALVRNTGITSDIYTYAEGSDLDEGGNVATHTIDLPWFKGPGDGGTFRVWSVLVTLRIPSTADNTDVRLQTYTVSHNDPAKDPEIADTNRIYSFTGTNAAAGLKTIRVKPVKQRCAAFRCRVEVSNSTTVPVSVVSVKYVYGVESESAKSPNRAEGQVG